MKKYSDRRFKCPYCSLSGTRTQLVDHVESKHADMIPQDYTAARVVFNSINKKTHGTCIVCGADTEWNEKTWKYGRLCNNPVCKKTLSDAADKNMLRTKGTITLLNDPDHQVKMLQGRSISGKYTFSDEGSIPYVGSYEKKCLEFMDKVMNISSKDILAPGPIIEYEYEGKQHTYISDIYYIPYNLIIEVKDGGSNPNNREMGSYREKQLAKEKAIINMDKYNYLRLTNNNFEQLISILVELKAQMLDDKDNKNFTIRIHEEVGGIPPRGAVDTAYMIPYGYKSKEDDDVEGFALATSIPSDNILVVDDNFNVKRESMIEFLSDRKFSIYEYYGKDIGSKYLTVLEAYKDKKEVDTVYLFEQFAGYCPKIADAIEYDNRFKMINLNLYKEMCDICTSTILAEAEEILSTNISMSLTESKDVSLSESILSEYNDINIAMDQDGYYAYDTKSKMRTKSHGSIMSLKETGALESLSKLIENGHLFLEKGVI